MMAWQLPSGYRPKIHDDLEDAGLSPEPTPGGTIHGWRRAALLVLALAMVIGLVASVMLALGA